MTSRRRSRNNYHKSITYGGSIPRAVIMSRKLDSDGDGVKNYKDCQPFNPKKQGKLHDTAINILRKKEEFLEKRREKEMQKLNDESDRLKEKLATVKARQNKRNEILEKKLAIKKEIDNEKKQIRNLKEANTKAKSELFKASALGKASKTISETGKKVFNKKNLKKSQSILNKTVKFIKKL